MHLLYSYIRVFLLWFAFSTVTPAMATPIDSLLIALNYTQPDSNRVLIFNELSYEYYNTDKEKALAYAEKALALAQELNFDRGIARSYTNIGNAYEAFHSYLDAQEHFLQAINIAYNNNQIEWAVGAFNGLGNIYTLQGNYKKAVGYYFRILKLSTTYSADNIVTLQNIGECYRKEGKIDQALKYLLQARELRERFEVHNGTPSLYSSLGMVYLAKGQVNNALNWLNRALNFSLQEGENGNYLVPTILEQLARVYFHKKEFVTAQSYLDRAMNIATAQQNIAVLKDIHQTYALIEEQFGNAPEALYHFKRHEALKDSLYGIYKREELAARQHVVQLEQKEKELELAKKDAEINRIQAERQEIIILLGSLVMLLLGGGGSALWVSYQKLKKQNKKERRLNSIINAQNQEIITKNLDLERQQKELVEQNYNLEKALKDLRETQSQLVHSEKMVSLGVLTAGIAHEINNPINFITSGIAGLTRALSAISKVLTYYEELNEDNVSEKLQEIQAFKKKRNFHVMLPTAQKVADNIEMGARRAAAIVKELRTFSRLEQEEFSKFDVHEGIESTLVLLRSQYKNRIEVIKDFGELPPILGNAGRLNQAFMNLLANAVQAIKTEGQIIITTRYLNAQKRIQIAFTDTGVGIPEEIKGKIFEPFYTTKETGQGTGLGLSITNSIVEQHQGTLQVNSVVGEGTTFTMELPINPVPPQPNLTL